MITLTVDCPPMERQLKALSNAQRRSPEDLLVSMFMGQMGINNFRYEEFLRARKAKAASTASV